MPGEEAPMELRQHRAHDTKTGRGATIKREGNHSARQGCKAMVAKGMDKAMSDAALGGAGRTDIIGLTKRNFGIL